MQWIHKLLQTYDQSFARGSGGNKRSYITYNDLVKCLIGGGLSREEAVSIASYGVSLSGDEAGVRYGLLLKMLEESISIRLE